MIIETISTIKHDTLILEKGKKYDVPEHAAHYFINNGWAKPENGEALPVLKQEHVLEIQDGTVIQSSDVGRLEDVLPDIQGG